MSSYSCGSSFGSMDRFTVWAGENMDQNEIINLGTCREEDVEKITFYGLGLNEVDVTHKPTEWQPLLENAGHYLEKEIIKAGAYINMVDYFIRFNTIFSNSFYAVTIKPYSWHLSDAIMDYIDFDRIIFNFRNYWY